MAMKTMSAPRGMYADTYVPGDDRLVAVLGEVGETRDRVPLAVRRAGVLDEGDVEVGNVVHVDGDGA